MKEEKNEENWNEDLDYFPKIRNLDLKNKRFLILGLNLSYIARERYVAAVGIGSFKKNIGILILMIIILN